MTTDTIAKLHKLAIVEKISADAAPSVTVADERSVTSGDTDKTKKSLGAEAL